MVGIKAVADLAGVSTATVSRALQGSSNVSAVKKQRVFEAQKQLGYVPSSQASSLASGRTRNIGVVVPRVTSWFFTSIINGIQHALLEQGYDTTLYSLSNNANDREKIFETHLLRKRVDGVVAICLEITEREKQNLLNLDIPLVVVGGNIQNAPSITIDHSAAAYLATSHLLTLGHTRIAHIGGSREYDIDFHVPTQRKSGYHQALLEAGLTPEDCLARVADFTVSGGYNAAKQLFGTPNLNVTAIFADSDEMAIGALLAAKDFRIAVPEQVSVIGIDDHELSDFFGLTTVAQFPENQGSHAIELVLKLLNPDTDCSTEPSTSKHLVLPVELLIRSSTSAPDTIRPSTHS